MAENIPDKTENIEFTDSEPTKKPSERIECECGKSITKKQYGAHLASAVHVKALTEKKNKSEEQTKSATLFKKVEVQVKLKDQFDLLNKKLDYLTDMLEDVVSNLFDDEDEDGDEEVDESK